MCLPLGGARAREFTRLLWPPVLASWVQEVDNRNTGLSRLSVAGIPPGLSGSIIFH
jgi:hypothetical protein